MNIDSRAEEDFQMLQNQVEGSLKSVVDIIDDSEKHDPDFFEDLKQLFSPTDKQV